MAKQHGQEEVHREQQKQEEVPVIEIQENTGVVKDLFQRKIMDGSVVRQLKMRRTLTRPLRSMSKAKSLAVECTSDIFTMELPLKGRSGGLNATRVFEAKELIPTAAGFVDGDEVLVLCHEVMCNAIGKAGFKSLKTNPDEKSEQAFIQADGKTLVGSLLGFLSGDIEDGKKYRSISVAELE